MVYNTKYLFRNILESFSLLIQHGISHFIKKNKDLTDYIQIVINIQSAFEFILKLDAIYSK